MTRSRRLISLTMLAALGSIAGCTSRTPPAEPAAGRDAAPKVDPPASNTVHYKLTGVVRRVKSDSGQVVIAHESIPGFMNAMTMPFSIKDHSLLDELRPGDEVEGDLRVEKEGKIVKEYELTDLVVTRPALPAPKKLVFSTKNLTLKEAPQRLEVGDQVPDFAMTTQEGKPLRLSDLRGEVVVLTFIYTRCPLPDFCPLMDRKFSELAGKITASPGRSEQVRLLSVSFDPEHDTPEILRKHAEVQGARPPLWTFAVAAHDELAKVAAPLGLTYGPTSTEIIHNLCTAVINRDGRLARLDVGTASKNLQASELLKFVVPLISDPPVSGPAPLK